MFTEFIKDYGTVAVPIGFLAMLIIRSGYYKFDDNLRRGFIVCVFAAIAYHLHILINNFALTMVAWPLASMITLSCAYLWRKWGVQIYLK